MEIFNNFPFDTEKNPIIISQWFHGPYSHQNFMPYRPIDLTYAIDFALPVNTAIQAVKKWVVTAVRDDSSKFYDWIDPIIWMDYGIESNLITIKHTNHNITYETQFIHLAKESIRVQVWDIVHPWDVIAYSGKSWWIWPYPHLHFQYTYFQPKKWRISLPFWFKWFNQSLEHKDL